MSSAAAMPWSIRNHIAIDPDICGGKPRIAEHRITVQNIVIWHERAGMSPDDIVAAYPQLTLADVHAALAYYWDHRDQIRAQIKADEDFVDSLEAANPSRLAPDNEREPPLSRPARSAEDEYCPPPTEAAIPQTPTTTPSAQRLDSPVSG